MQLYILIRIITTTIWYECLNFVTVIICVITYKVVLLVDSVAVFRVHPFTVTLNIPQQWALFTCCCGCAFAKTVLQSILQSRIFAAFILRLNMQNPGDVLISCYMPYQKCSMMLNWYTFIFSCDQAALWMVFSVRLSVCPSVCPSVTPFWLCSHHPIIMNFSGFITLDQGKVHAKGQGHRGHDPNFLFRTVTPVWIHIWWWNDTYSLMLLRRGALLFFKVIRQISRSHGAKIAEFDPDWAFPDCNSSLNSPMAMKCCTKLEVA